MRITEKIAKEVINKICPIIGEEISITDDKGIVVGSSDPQWLGKTYKEAILTMNKRRILEVQNEEGDSGINFPIFLGDSVIGVLWITGEGGHIKEIGKLMSVTIELLLHQKFANTRKNLQKCTIDNLVGNLMYREYSNWQDTTSCLKILGYDLSLPRFAIVMGIPKYNLVTKNVLKIVQESFPKKPPYYDIKEKVLSICKAIPQIGKEDILVNVSSGLFVIFKAKNKLNLKGDVFIRDVSWTKKLLSKLKNEIDIEAFLGIGPCKSSSLSDLKESFRDAVIALEMGLNLSEFFEKKIFFYEEPMILLGECLKNLSVNLKRKFVYGVLNSIKKEKYSEEKLLTLKTYFKCNMNIKDSANKLFIHKNTLVYRLKRIKDITSLNPQKHLDAFYLWLALQIEELNNRNMS